MRAPATKADEPDADVSTVWYGAFDQRRRDAFGLRHTGYVDAGLIPRSPWGIYTDPYDDLPSTLVAALYRDGTCIATLRISLYTPGAAGPSLPCEKVYPEVPALKASASGLVVELSRLAIDPSITNTHYRARLYAAAIRTGISACIALDAKRLLVATQTKWRVFYEHVIGFKVVGPAQFYPPGDVPVVLLERELDEGLKRRMSKNAFFKISEDGIQDLRERLPHLLGPGLLGPGLDEPGNHALRLGEA